MEHLNLLGCLHHAAEHVHAVPESDLGAQLVALTDAMAGYLRNNGPWDTAEQVHENSAGIAKHLDYTRAQAVALNDLGITRRLRGNLEGADQALQEARGIFRRLSDTRTSRLGQANTLNEMGLVANETGRRTGDRDHHKHAAKVLREAWELYNDSHVDDTVGKANSAKNLGVALYRLSGSTDAGAAIEWLSRSLANYSEIEDVLGVVEVRNHLGLLYLESRDQKKALVEFEKATNLMNENEIGSLLEEARAHEGIGLCRERNGEVADAMTSFKKAEGIYSRIRAGKARDRVTRKLDELRIHADP
jgi:tetratricopeptide (TPR) repeat protein